MHQHSNRLTGRAGKAATTAVVWALMFDINRKFTILVSDRQIVTEHFI